MADASGADPGVPLREAVERWTPEELWRRYCEIAGHDLALFFAPGANPLQDEARRLHQRIAEILADKLRRRELIASGIALPLRPTSRRRDIRPELWARLRINLRQETAVGGGLEIVELLFREAQPATPPAARTPERPRRAAARRTRGPGRPTIMPALEAEMRRRAGAGRLEPSLRREAAALAEWAEQEIDDVHVPKPETIERQLGRVYRELRARKRPDK